MCEARGFFFFFSLHTDNLVRVCVVIFVLLESNVFEDPFFGDDKKCATLYIMSYCIPTCLTWYYNFLLFM